jgi:hypothetical protein
MRYGYENRVAALPASLECRDVFSGRDLFGVSQVRRQIALVYQ